MADALALTDLPPWSFEKDDPDDDAAFYAEARLVTHIDDGAIAALTAFYRRTLPAGGVVLDLMSSCVSHLPSEVAYAEVIGHGMNAAELAANPFLRAEEPSVQAAVGMTGADPAAVFAEVRARKDRF